MSRERRVNQPEVSFRYDRGIARERAPARERAIGCAYSWSMIFCENRFPPRIKSGAGFFGIML